MAKDVHVVPADNGWAVELASSPADRQLFDTQEAAIASGTALARQNQVELFVYGRDGRIRERNSFGHDPRNIPG
ncbi:DUF2188 domain-containing protein [Cupriavidus sp. KB_39]|uniref:DUF2188 domain-containing protein n=1 Tax=Cupriavidus sp. KB_39 TaxID=3233036 RepID=UPI003F923491